MYPLLDTDTDWNLAVWNGFELKKIDMFYVKKASGIDTLTTDMLIPRLFLSRQLCVRNVPVNTRIHIFDSDQPVTSGEVKQDIKNTIRKGSYTVAMYIVHVTVWRRTQTVCTNGAVYTIIPTVAGNRVAWKLVDGYDNRSSWDTGNNNPSHNVNVRDEYIVAKDNIDLDVIIWVLPEYIPI